MLAKHVDERAFIAARIGGRNGNACETLVTGFKRRAYERGIYAARGCDRHRPEHLRPRTDHQMAMALSSSAASSNDIVILPGMKSSGRQILSPPKDRSSIRTNSPGGSSVIPTRQVEICRSSGRNKYERRACQDTTRGAPLAVLTRSGSDAKMIWVRVLLR